MTDGDAISPISGGSRSGSGERCLVMTGGTSGIGRRVLRKLLSERANWSVILLARPSPQADALGSLPGASERLAIVNADLASLGAVDRACGEVVRLLGPRPIDALALNAGIQTVTGVR
ncbi:MAG: SDR family NAD(P)-dependent oxidoreductase, partial [Alphaproteobacteria bacterium]